MMKPRLPRNAQGEVDGDKAGINILPTGECFEDTFRKFIELIRGRPELRDGRLLLVHGILLMPQSREPYSHAWLELDGNAIQSGLRSDTLEKIAVVMSIEHFHQEMEVQECTKYDFPAIMDLGKTCPDAAPPWEEKYRALLRKPGSPTRIERRS